ncbi:MAG: 30S ribosomal protein S6 [Candidatus Niyogibacteria bacterium]|nr:30S ribosomal protein S6 [Candidatus Niyogibacteria bacterium]
MTESDPILYELYYTLKADSADGAASNVNALVLAIEKEHGIIASQTNPMLKPLAYPIGKIREAYTGWLRFMIKPESAPKLDATLRGEPALVRFIFVRAKKEEASPEPLRRRKRVSATANAPEVQANIEEIDKKLEEILGT